MPALMTDLKNNQVQVSTQNLTQNKKFSSLLYTVICESIDLNLHKCEDDLAFELGFVDQIDMMVFLNHEEDGDSNVSRFVTEDIRINTALFVKRHLNKFHSVSVTAIQESLDSSIAKMVVGA
jgi:hypothetical protein